MSLTKAELTAKASIEAEIQALLDAGNAQERPWSGNKELVNPSVIDPKTKKPVVIGTQETANINIIVPAKLFARVESALPKLSGSGNYIRNNFYGVELICTNAYEGKVSGEPELQYTYENTPRTNAHGTPEAKDRFAKVFNRELKKMSVDTETGEVKETVKEEVPF